MKFSQSNRRRIANYLSTAFSPYIIAALIIPIVIFVSTERVMEALFWSIVVPSILIGPTLAYVGFEVRKGNITDMHIRERVQRSKVYVIGIVSLIFLVFILSIFDAPNELQALIYSVAIGNVISFIINMKWKISLHAEGMGGATVITLFIFGYSVAIVMSLISIAVFWSRIELQEHTLMQLVAGYSIAVVVTIGVFLSFGLTIV